MSTLKLNGSTSGSSIIKAPDSGSTGQTFTLPASTGTLVTTADAGVDGITSAADATAIKIDSSERVAIGNTDAGNYHSSADNLVVYDATQHAGITIASGGTDKTGNIYFADGTSGDAEYEGYIEYNHNSNAMTIGTNHANSLQMTSDGRGLSQFTAKAWANFDTTDSTFRDNHNFSSITDIGTGVQRLNFTNNMANTNYSAVVSSQGGTNSGADSWNTSWVQTAHRTNNGNNSSVDVSHNAIVVFGD